MIRRNVRDRAKETDYLNSWIKEIDEKGKMEIKANLNETELNSRN